MTTYDIDMDEAAGTEHIHTRTHLRREAVKNSHARLRKGHCAKAALSRKQALTRASVFMNRPTKLAKTGAQQLRSYKCPHCGYWHITKQPPRRA